MLQITIEALRDCILPEQEILNERYDAVEFKKGETTNYYNCIEITMNTKGIFICIRDDIMEENYIVTLPTADFKIVNIEVQEAI